MEKGRVKAKQGVNFKKIKDLSTAVRFKSFLSERNK